MRLFILWFLVLVFVPPLSAGSSGLQDIVALLDSGEPAKALLRADTALTHGGKQPQAQFLQARALAALGRDAAAISIYRDLIKQFPSLPEPRVNLAALLVKAGKIAQAQKVLRNVFAAEPSLDIAYQSLNAIYAHRARQAYQSALQQQKETHAPIQLAGIHKITSYRPEVLVQPKAIKPSKKFQSEIKIVLQKWKNAWSDKNPDVYLQQYAKIFVPESAVDFLEWSEYRRKRLLAPKFIHVSIDDIEFTDHKDGFVSAIFKQTYSSNTFKDSVNKTLTFKKVATHWKIIKEVIVQ